MKKLLSFILSFLMMITSFSVLSLSAQADTIPTPTGLKCTYYNPENGYVDFEWEEVKFPPLPEEVPNTAYNPEAGYTFYWSTDGEDWNYEECTNNFIYFCGDFPAGKTYYIKVAAWIRTWSRVGTIHASYSYGEDSKVITLTTDSPIPAPAHVHEYLARITKEPTCTEAGTKKYICSCGEVQSTESIPAFGHQWDGGKVTVKATSTAKGKRVYTCQICGKTKSESIPVLKMKANTLTAKAKTVKVRYSKLKKAKITISAADAMTVKKAKGTVTYKKTSGSSKVTVNKKTGKLTIKKKGLKKGKTYKIAIKITAAGTDKYKKASKTVTVKIKVT